MSAKRLKHVIQTERERCKVCYTCIKECPAKAIKVEKGQAQIIIDRCVHCGNCVKVCRQEAKQILSSIEDTNILLEEAVKENQRVAIMLAPSFPAEFTGIEAEDLSSYLKDIGFSFVFEVGFGADVVAYQYGKLIRKNPEKSYISSSCPSIVSYIEKYHPDLVDNIIPLGSPMMAMAKVIKQLKGDHTKIVFAGPCGAKKREMQKMPPLIDVAITFRELTQIFKDKGVDLEKSHPEPTPFDPPSPNLGGLFSLSSGLLQTAGLQEDLLKGEIINADGKNNFVPALKEFEHKDFSPRLLDLLSCEGCIMGPGMGNNDPLYKKRGNVSRYLQKSRQTTNQNNFVFYFDALKDIDIRVNFTPKDHLVENIEFTNDEIKTVLKKFGKEEPKDELNCMACGYDSCREHAKAILMDLAEPEMCLPYTIDKLKKTVSDLELSYDELKNVKEILSHREKLASMGQLSAGIAHELNNPLGVVLMFTHNLQEELKEKLNDETQEDLSVIIDQANRCKRIVSGLLNFSRQNKVIKTEVSIISFLEYVVDSLSVPSHVNIRLVKPENNREIIAEFDKDQISQVLINLINNSIDALNDHANTNEGEIELSVEKNDRELAIIVKDNGVGIPESLRSKIFEPFFTTKQMGRGTGLGLPVCYGIIKMHKGNIEVFSYDDPETSPTSKTGTTVKVTLPLIEDIMSLKKESL